MWDLVTRDYSKRLTGPQVLAKVKKYVRNGSIITFHDSLKAESHLRWALPRAIEFLKAEGYEFGKIEFPKTRRLYATPFIQRIRKIRNNLRQLRRWA